MNSTWIHRAFPPLLRDVAFRRYWLGQSLSLTGGQISMLAFPLTAVLVLKTNAIGMALITAVGALPALLLSISVGAWVDRRGHRRQIMILADLLRALLIALIPVAWGLNLLSLPLLIGLWFGVGICSVFFRVSSDTVFVALVPREKYSEANGLLQQSQSAGFLIGPALGGWLIQVFTAPGALLGDALSFLASALSLSMIHPQEPPDANSHDQHIWEGIRFVRSSLILRSTFAAQLTQSFFRAMFTTLYILYATRYLHVTPLQWGLIFGPSSVFAILGASFTNRLSRRVGLGLTLIIGSALFTLPLLVVPLIAGRHAIIVAALFLAEGVSGAGAMIQAVASATIRTSAVPDSIRARVMAAFTMAGRGMTPLGAAGAALLAWQVGVHFTLLVATVGLSVSFLWLLTPSIISLRNHEQLQPVAK
ncbi:MAG: MFS transporter [Sulfobacillus thermotolerans]|nr:MFS transporter [Sulfobacillus thermotolerans]